MSEFLRALASRGCASDWSMITLVSSVMGSILMARASSIPFIIPGISMSIMARAYRSPSAIALHKNSSASSPLAAEVHRIPKEVSCARTISRSVALLSASNTCLAGRGFCFAGAAFPTACFANRAVNQNVDPLPGSLSTPISPCIIFTSCREIVSPSPVPP